MTPNPNRQAVIVGLFVTGAVGILAGGILTIGRLNDTFTRKITVSAVFDQVNGLQQGDNIWFSGLKVGTVSALAFSDDSQVAVELQVDQAAVPYIHDDVTATIGSDGLIGSRIVVLSGGTEARPLIVDGSVLAIGEVASTEAIMATLQENNVNLLAITTDIKGITARITAGEGTIGKLVQDDALYTEVNGVVTSLRTASDRADTITASLATFSADLNRPGTLPHDLIHDRTTWPEVTATVAELRQTGAVASTAVSGLAKAAADPTSALGVVLRDAEVGADLKVTLANLGDSTELLKEDLLAIQHNFLFRGYFKKQERQAAKAAKKAAQPGS
jgi:phospholipid/cholesterol/gamma-HCH transport system substrate-binding protein